ncbi:MAG: DNA integrity scanning protein DisA nucleotide-binding domain protein [Mollicutes bacterium PWAP]|nr:DNA integrity scanning protein DisA nucleotide-binding domain protein [Mollicutes bacterium PWAP]
MTNEFIFATIIIFGFLIIALISWPIGLYIKTRHFNPKNIKRKSPDSKIRTYSQIAEAVEVMSKEKIGALITFQRDDDLNVLQTDGIKLGSLIVSSVIVALFRKESDVHDGSMILYGDKIERIGSFFEIDFSSQIKNKNFGARHRAASGITKSSDAISITVSEETGKIHIFEDGIPKLVKSKDIFEELNRRIKGSKKFNKIPDSI